MKKNKILVACLCFTLLVFSAVMLACGDNDYGFTRSKHEYFSVEYGEFSTYSIKEDGLEFHVSGSIFTNDKAAAKKMFDNLKADYKVLNDTFDIDTEIKIYVLKKSVLDGSDLVGNHIYCNPSAFKNLEYRDNLTQAYINTIEPWQQKGLSSYLFDSSNNDGFLRDYYNDDDNLMTLSLFAAYFSSSFSDTDTLAAARKSAESFTEYLITQYSVEDFLQVDTLSEYRQEWLDFMGIDSTFYLPYNTDWLSGARYSKTRVYPLIITTSTREYYLSPIAQGDYGTLIIDDFSTAENVLKELSENISEVDRLLESIAQIAPKAHAEMLRRYNEKISYYVFYNKARMSYANRSRNTIELCVLDSFVHETIHILTLSSSDSGKWLYEGIAEYFSVQVLRINGSALRMFLSVTEPGDVSDNLMQYIQLCNDYYLAKGGSLDSIEEFDEALNYEAVAVASLNYPDLAAEWKFQSIKEVYGIDSDDPQDQLSYPESYLFVKYLVERTSLETVLLYTLNEGIGNFEETFGGSFSEVFAELLESIKPIENV